MVLRMQLAGLVPQHSGRRLDDGRVQKADTGLAPQRLGRGLDGAVAILQLQGCSSWCGNGRERELGREFERGLLYLYCTNDTVIRPR